MSQNNFHMFFHPSTNIIPHWSFLSVPIMHCGASHGRSLSSFALVNTRMPAGLWCSSNWTWSVPQTTLDQLYGQFLLVLESLTRFWDILDEIDRNTWVLEPEKPCRSDTMRRVAIGTRLLLVARMKMARVIWGVKPVFDEPSVYICREQRVHQSRGGSQTPGDAAGLLPAGSRARWVHCPAEAHQPRSQHLFSDIFPLISSLLQLSAIAFVYARSATPSLLPSNPTCKILNTGTPQSPRWAADLQTWWLLTDIAFFACKSNK